MISSEKYKKCLPTSTEQRYSFQGGSPPNLSLSKRLTLIDSKSQMKLKENELFDKLATTQIKNMITNKVSITRESDAMLKQITQFESSGHYFNQKYYDDKHQEMKNKNHISLRLNLENNGDQRRTLQNDYHSSDGRRSMFSSNNAEGLISQSSLGKLFPLKTSNKQDSTSTTINIENSKNTQNLSNTSEVVQNSQETIRNKHNSEKEANKKSRFRVIKWKTRSLPLDTEKQSKMSSYVFKKKDEKSATDDDKSSNANQSDAPQNKSTTPEEFQNNQNRIKEENNKLIELMLMGRKRQNSLPNEILFQSNILQQKKPSNRKVLKRFHKKSTVNPSVNQSIGDNKSNESSTQSTKHKSKQNLVTPNLNQSSKFGSNPRQIIEDLMNKRTINQNKDEQVLIESPNKTEVRKGSKVIHSISKGLIHSSSNPDAVINQNTAIIKNAKIRENNKIDLKHSKTDQHLESYKLSSSLNSNRLDSESERVKVSTSPIKRTTEQIIAQSLAELAKINEENDSKSDWSLQDPSPKINVDIKDTWGTNTPRLNDTVYFNKNT